MKRFNMIAGVTCGVFTAAVIVYTGALAAAMSDDASAAGAYGLLFKNIMLLFVFSLAVGCAELIFSLQKLPPAAKRVIHVLAVYAVTLVCALLMANTGKDARQIVLFIFILTLLYTVVYTAASLIIHFVRKAGK